MALPGFYNDNQFRDYPFETRVEPQASFEPSSDSSSEGPPRPAVPHGVLVDFGAIMEIDAEYSEEDDHHVYLYSLRYESDGTVIFDFRTNAPEGANHRILATREPGDAEFAITWYDSEAVGADPFDSLNCANLPKWSAFVVVGSIDYMGDFPVDETIYYPDDRWRIEPARVQSLKDSYLRACNLGNFARTHTTPAAGCSESESAANPAEPYINATCMQGNIQWKEGYNCAIRQDNRENAIIIGAGIGSGEGEPCEEVPVFEGESPPDNSPYLSGGPGCGEVVKTINGVGGRNVILKAGTGFSIYEEEDGTLVIDRTLDDFALCLGDESEVSISL
jgi:hypothetical protein